jgi:hypothetical protein
MSHGPSHPRRPPAGKHNPNSERHRALALLAGSVDGCTASIMLAHGFSGPLLVQLVRTGLATALPERMVAHGRTMEVIRMRITEAGWRALAER